jgi:hypothetical protein
MVISSLFAHEVRTNDIRPVRVASCSHARCIRLAALKKWLRVSRFIHAVASATKRNQRSASVLGASQVVNVRLVIWVFASRAKGLASLTKKASVS